MFLRPHHLQLAARNREEMLRGEVRRLQPFFWGLLRIDIAARPARELHVRGAGLRDQAEGRHLPVAGLEPPAAGAQLQDRARPGRRPHGGLARRARRGASSTPTRSRPARRSAARTGVGASRRSRCSTRTPAAIRRCSRRGARTAGSSSGARAARDTSAFRSRSSSAPARARTRRRCRWSSSRRVTEIGAWPVLENLCQSVTNRLEAKHRFLVSRGRGGQADGGFGGDDGLAAAPEAPDPRLVSLPLPAADADPARSTRSRSTRSSARLAGELSIFDDQKTPTACRSTTTTASGRCFFEITHIIEVAGREDRRVAVHPRRVHDQGGASRRDLAPEWLAPETEFYLLDRVGPRGAGVKSHASRP